MGEPCCRTGQTPVAVVWTDGGVVKDVTPDVGSGRRPGSMKAPAAITQPAATALSSALLATPTISDPGPEVRVENRNPGRATAGHWSHLTAAAGQAISTRNHRTPY